MNILVDTHIAIWIITDDTRLSPKAREILLTAGNVTYVSAISTLEVDIKTKSRKNNLDFSLDEFISMCEEAKLKPLPLTNEIIAEANRLIWEGEGDPHKDPFDRMLLAQAMLEGMQFMTADGKIPYFKQDCVISV